MIVVHVFTNMRDEIAFNIGSLFVLVYCTVAHCRRMFT